MIKMKTHSNLQDDAKAMFTAKFVALNTYVKNQEKDKSFL